MIDPPFGDYWVRKGRDKGRKEGRAEGQRQLLQMQLELRFGPLRVTAQERLESLLEEQRLQLAKALFQAQTLRELGLED